MLPNRQAPGEQDLSPEGPRAGQATPGDRSKELAARVARVSIARCSWRTETNLHLGRPSPETILSLRGGGPRGKEGEAGQGRRGGKQADRQGRKEKSSLAQTPREPQSRPQVSARGICFPILARSSDVETKKEKGAEQGGRLFFAQSLLSSRVGAKGRGGGVVGVTGFALLKNRYILVASSVQLRL